MSLWLGATNGFAFARAEATTPTAQVAAAPQGESSDDVDLTDLTDLHDLSESLSEWTENLLEGEGQTLPPISGRALVATLVLIALFTLISEDLACIGAGLLVAQDRLQLIPAMIACYTGILAGDLWLFWTGRLLGRAVVRRAPLRWWLKQEALERSSTWLRRYGAWVVLITRCVPWTRLPTTVAAGVLHTHAGRFTAYFALAGLFWVPLFVLVTASVGRQVIARVGDLRGGFLIAIVAFWLSLLLLQQVLIPLFSRKGRRRLLGRWRRWRHWEFWPLWLFYPPVALYILWLGLRYRAPTLFTAVNPLMPAGGVVGESKSAILRQLPEERVPAWTLVAGETPAQRTAAVADFRARCGLDYPIVLKPDVGERGRAVRIARSDQDVADYFEDPRLGLGHAILAQEFAVGREFGVFWAKGPEDPEGTILSITEKRPPVLLGDGRRTLEELILDDHRAVALYPVYLGEHPDATTRIPAAGEEITLVEIGAHCRGTIFVDACELATPELRDALGRLIAAVPGFDFGRFDLKVADAATLRAGGPFLLVEANGVTSECTHIYDRRHSVLFGWRVLCAQWRRAFAIGDQRRRAGHPPTSPAALWRLWRRAHAERAPG